MKWIHNIVTAPQRHKRRREENARREANARRKYAKDMESLQQKLASVERTNAEYLRTMTNMKNQNQALENLSQRHDRSLREQKTEFERRARQQKDESDRKMNELKVNK